MRASIRTSPGRRTRRFVAGVMIVAGTAATAVAQDRSSIRSIVATQNVTFHQVDPVSKKERYGVGERGDYDAATRVLTLTGNPRVWEGKNVMTGDAMIFHLDTHRFQVRGKVHLTIYPDEMKSSEKEKVRDSPQGTTDSGKAPEPPTTQESLQVTAAEAEYFNQENKIVFTGKVVARQGDATMTADRMEVTFTPPPEKTEKTGNGEPAGGRKP